MEHYDIAVIGGGSGGYTAAIRAAQLGARTILVERRELGGACMNRGCIPTKSLIASIEAMEQARKGSLFGFRADSIQPDLKQMRERKRQVVSRLVKGVEQLLKGNRVEWFFGTAELISRDAVKIHQNNGQDVSFKADKIVLATGSEPARRPDFCVDGKNVLTSDEALELESIPQSLLIIGAGAIGVEFARIFQALGTKVIVAEMENQILPGMDSRLAQTLSSSMKRSGMDVRIGSAIQNIKIESGRVVSEYANGDKVDTEKVLVSIGRVPNSSGIGLESIGVETKKGFVLTNEKMETSVPGIFAVGDLAGKWLLAYTAAQEGVTAVENALGRTAVMDYRTVPLTIFSDPETASVGLTEKDAAAKGIEVTVGRYLFAANGKALSLDETDGFACIVAESTTGEVVGGQIAGPHASDLIAEIALAVNLRIKAKVLAHTLHSHPTLAEAVMEAARDVSGESIHKLKK